ncbi:MAG: type II secretion system F family protein [Pseudomonadota bacterium]
MNLIFAFLAGVVVFCGYLLFDKAIADKKRRDSIRARLAPDGSSLSDEQQEASINLTGDPSPFAANLLSVLRSLTTGVDDSIRKLERRFAQAGSASPNGPIYYLFFKRIGSLVCFVLALACFLGANGDNELLFGVIGFFILIIGFFGPYLYLQNMIDRRKKILQRAFPDTLDLLLICVEAGLALDASLNRVCNELGRAHPEMTAELNRTRLELALINDRVRALMNLGERTDMVAFRSLVSALIQSERFGTSLTDTLRVLSEEFRVQRLTDAEVKAARLPVMMTVPLICFLMPALFIIVLGPAMVGVSHSSDEISSGAAPR